MCANKTVRVQYLKPVCKIELLVLHRNTWNHLSVCKLMNSTVLNN